MSGPGAASGPSPFEPAAEPVIGPRVRADPLATAPQDDGLKDFVGSEDKRDVT